MKVIKKFFLYLFLIVILLVFIVPFLYALYNSFLPLADVDKLVPFSHFTVDNYVTSVSYTHLDVYKRQDQSSFSV